MSTPSGLPDPVPVAASASSHDYNGAEKAASLGSSTKEGSADAFNEKGEAVDESCDHKEGVNVADAKVACVA